QKQALIFVREVGAIDNHTYRQMADCDTLRASNDLRSLKSYELLKSKGRGKATYYVPGSLLIAPIVSPDLQVTGDLSTQPSDLSTPPPGLSTPPPKISTPPPDVSTPPPGLSTPPPDIIPVELINEISGLKQREHDSNKIKRLIKKLCAYKALSSHEIAELFGKREDYFKRKYLSTMIESKELRYLHPEMINHPEQAYVTNKKD
ncbi:MAG: hypothetical protein H8D67_12075, partial [Deltaproteobacteria bacterium]|nr:hypothetical protein [Deltaproteobacteria bacterium]